MADYGNQGTPFAGMVHDIDFGHDRTRKCAEESIDWGIPIFSYPGDDINGYTIKQDVSVILLDADLVTDNTITTTLTIDGVAQTPVATAFDTNHDTTMTNHKNDLEAAFANLTVTLTDDVDNREFTLLLKGENITLLTSVVTGGASQAGTTITYSNGQIFQGFARFTQQGDLEVGSYYENEAMNVRERGFIWVDASLAVNDGEDVYVIWQTGANQGKITNVATDNYETECKFRGNTTGAGAVLVEVNGIHTDVTP
jgi:hypothetical protein